MNIIQLKEANCKSCYKCIRNCELKAIKFANDQARILDDDCVLCGKCTLVCPQNAKQIKSDLPEIKKYLESGMKVAISLAPSYISAFPNVSFAEMSAALKKLGFIRVEETAIGAQKVSKEYMRLIEEKKMKNIITTCCPSTVMLLEKYYPEVLPCLAPVVSPATAHAKMLKEIYGNRIKVVFVGPCISKKYEAQMGNNINAVLMFEELRDWLKEENIEFQKEDEEASEIVSTISRLYPVPGGIINTIPYEKRKNYRSISVDGLDRCIEILDSIRDNDVEGYFIEMSVCAGSCVQGPGLHNFKTPFLISKSLIFDTVRKKTQTPMPMTESTNTNLDAHYTHTRVLDKIPSEEQIKEILAKIGKTSPESMLNCGTCGYPTCRDKAIAVFQGKADLKMCLPYMREKAESMSNIIIENTPNAIFMIDHDFNVLEYNRAARELFHIEEKSKAIGMPIEMFLSPENFVKLRETNESVFDSLSKSQDGTLSLRQTILSVSHGDYLVLVRDVTKEEESNEELEQIRKETVETAQKVIDKQMRVAQEIASLLGETTGETKAALTKLKKSIAQGGHL